jgi:ABC-type spermidine/putrescine transport system permease subunit I
VSAVSAAANAPAPTGAAWLRLGAGWLVAPLVAFLGIVYFWPVLGLLATSVTDPEIGLHHYQRFFERPIFMQVLLRTFSLAGFVTVAVILIGYPITYAMRMASPLAMKAILFLIFLPFWASVMVRTYGIMVIFGRDGIVNNMLMSAGMSDGPIAFMYNTWMVRIAMVQIMLPFLILPLYSVTRNIDQNLLQAAKGLGARPLMVFLRVYLPLSMPGIIAGALIVFVLSLGFFITPALLGGRQDIMISMLILNQFEAQLNWGFGATLSTVVLVVTMAALLALGRFAGNSTGAGR